MSSFILLWNPRKFVWDDFEEWRDAVTKYPPQTLTWSMAGRKRGVDEGDLVYLFRVGDQRGIVGFGQIVRHDSGEILEWDEHWDEDQVITTPYIAADFFVLVDGHERLTQDELEAHVPDVKWQYLQSSGVKVPDTVEAELIELWNRHVERLNGD